MARRVLLLAALLWTGWQGCSTTAPETSQNVRVRVDRVAVDNHNIPVLLLQEEEGSRWLPIWIGTAEARSIAMEMEEQASPRPNTHDLARSVIDGLDGEVVRVVVTELRGGTYYAVLALRVRGRIVEIDSRPSDAIAIALRTGAPIFVNVSLFDSVGEPAEEEEPPEEAPGQEI